MPSVQDMMSRKSSITNAFANAIIPLFEPTLEDIAEALKILDMDPSDVRCAFCGDPASEWDHLRPLVLKRRATGYLSEIANLVPACGKCNQSKGNKPWREWMLSNAPRSPSGRKIADLAHRMTRLERYEAWRTPRCLDVEQIIGTADWNAYWSLCDQVIDELRKAKAVADGIKERIRQSSTC
jgi:hypothetical protein